MAAPCWTRRRPAGGARGADGRHERGRAAAGLYLRHHGPAQGRGADPERGRANAASVPRIFGITPADRVLTVLPLFHVGGLNIQTVPALLAGASAAAAPALRARTPSSTRSRAHRPGLSLVVPAVMQALVAHPRWAAADLSSLRAIGAGSSEVPLPLIEAFHASGIPVQQVYGATETCPIAIAQTRAEALAHPGSIGRPRRWGRRASRTRREGRFRPAPRARSRCAARMSCSGYWRAPEATAAALRDGWFATGDIGRMDAAGPLLVHRPAEARDHLGRREHLPGRGRARARHRARRAEGAVCGRPDPRWGEVPVAVVVPGPGFDPAAVLRHFEGRIARFKHPRVVVRWPLPRTALGKVHFAALSGLVRLPE